MKAVTSLRSRMRSFGEGARSGNTVGGSAPTSEALSRCRSSSHRTTNPSPLSSSAKPIGRISGEGGSSAAAASTACTEHRADGGMAEQQSQAPLIRRAWAMGPRKLRGLHASPMIVYVRENPELVTRVMDRLYATMVTAYEVDSKDIKVTNVPTVYDLPCAVRKMGKGKHVVVVVGCVTEDKLWFDREQISRVRDSLLDWSQKQGIPLIDGLLVGECQSGLEAKITSPKWSIKHCSSDTFGDSSDDADGGARRARESVLLNYDDEIAAGDILAFPKSRPSIDAVRPPKINDDDMFGHYLAHRAMEMFYFEHRGW